MSRSVTRSPATGILSALVISLGAYAMLAIAVVFGGATALVVYVTVVLGVLHGCSISRTESGVTSTGLRDREHVGF